jgi:hypothetical protein
MMRWESWTLPPAIVLSLVAPAQAAQYLTLEQAQQAAFPTATRFVESHAVFRPQDIAAIEQKSGQKIRSRGEQIWKAQAGTRTLGFFILDYVVGKHLVIDYGIALDPVGVIIQVEILEYRESYGGEIANPEWLGQFIGKSSRDPLEIDHDIRNISGATLSSRHLTEGIKRVLAIHDTLLR